MRGESSYFLKEMARKCCLAGRSFATLKVIKTGFYSGKYWATVSGIGVTISSTCNKPPCSPPVEQCSLLRKLIQGNLVTAAGLWNLNCSRIRKAKMEKRNTLILRSRGNPRKCGVLQQQGWSSFTSCTWAETNTSSLLLQISRWPKAGAPVTTSVGKFSLPQEAFSREQLLARELQNQTHSFSDCSSIFCLVLLWSLLPVPVCRAGPGLPAHCASAASQRHSLVLLVLCQMSLETLPLLFTNSFTSEEYGACPHLKTNLD